MPVQKEVLIVGATAPEVFKLVEAINEDGGDSFHIAGIIDDDSSKHGSVVMGYPVLGSIRSLAGRYSGHWIVNNVAKTTLVRRKVWNLIEETGDRRFPVLVHPGVDTKYAEIGCGTIIQEGCIVGPGVSIGKQCLISFRNIIAHESDVGDCCFLSPGAIINGRVRIREGVFVGAGAIILPNVTVGEWSKVGAGSLVMTNVPPHCTVFGSPARIISRGAAVVHAHS